MPLPWKSTVHIDGLDFQAFAAEMTVFTEKNDVGMPLIGTQFTAIKVWADASNDVDFTRLQKFFELANIVSQERIVDIKMEFWKDEQRADATCTFSFRGWIAKYSVMAPMPGTEMADKSNTILYLELEPEVNETHYKEISIGN